LVISPNPGTGLIKIINNALDLSASDVLIIDAIGKSFPVKLMADGFIDISGFPTGIYQLKIWNGETNTSGVFIKQ